MHHNNMLSDAKAYAYEENGKAIGEMVSIKEALLSDEWDVVTLQQASLYSGNYKTYQPYLSELCNFIKINVPKAQIMIHQTWAYEQGSDRLTKRLGYKDQRDMYEDIKKAYNMAAKDCGNLKIIPCGAAFQEAIKLGIYPLHRDTYHASRGVGRYILSAVWYCILTGKSIINNSFCDFDEKVDTYQLFMAQACVQRVIKEYA